LRWRRWRFSDSLIVFGNALPKSGSKLLLQLLQGIQRAGPFRPLRPFPIRTITQDGVHRQQADVVLDLQRLVPGDMAVGYLPAEGPYASILTQPDWASFLLVRDPRDLLVSHIHYATDIHEGHSMRARYLALPDFSARLKVAIQGTETYPHLPSVGQRYRGYLPYLADPNVMVLKFEDLRLQPETEIDRMLGWIEARGGVSFDDRTAPVANVVEAIQPGRSPTFRKGIPGEWRERYTPEHKALFNKVAPGLLQELGYEETDDW
jgi:hypothetical protein